MAFHVDSERPTTPKNELDFNSADVPLSLSDTYIDV